MKHLLILISFLLLSSPIFGQSERPETIIVPVSGIGDVSNTRKLILGNTLTDELKKHFRIVPQEKYEQVLEQVFLELEYEECSSEDTCIMRVQEMLQVENVFNLQIIGEGKDSQLNLKWITLDEKKNETDYCEGCKTKELNDKVRGLVEKLVGEKRVEVVVQKKPVVVVEKKGKGVLYLIEKNGEWGWYKSGDEKNDGEYVGDIEDGKPNGQGTITFPNGTKYVGEWSNGKKNGYGTNKTKITQYEGYYKDDLRHGSGKWIIIDKLEYVGDWKNGKQNGQGTLNYIDEGFKYEGEFKDGEYHGYGRITTYEGSFKGMIREGEFKDGSLNGKGKIKLPNGNIFEGEFTDGELPGNGTLNFPNGYKYIGELDNNLVPNGRGKITFPSSSSNYIGEWKNGKPNGQGTYTLEDGGRFIGEFRNGKPWNTKLYDGKGRFRGRKVNGQNR